MSLQKKTSRIDAVLQGAVVLVTLVVWAAIGFPYVREFIALGCLSVAAIGAYWWVTRRAGK
jgi:hypothetical protein